MRYVILMCVFLGSNFGCSVNGFRQVPNGLTTPSQLRSAAAIARAEATALDQIAEQQEGFILKVTDGARQAAETLGAPAALTGLLGLAGGWMVPTPGQRKRTQQAKAEGRIEAKS